MRTIWASFTLVELEAVLLTLGVLSELVVLNCGSLVGKADAVVSSPPDMSFCAIGIPVSELGFALPNCRTAGIDAGSVR